MKALRARLLRLLMPELPSLLFAARRFVQANALLRSEKRLLIEIDDALDKVVRK